MGAAKRVPFENALHQRESEFITHSHADCASRALKVSSPCARLGALSERVRRVRGTGLLLPKEHVRRLARSLIHVHVPNSGHRSAGVMALASSVPTWQRRHEHASCTTAIWQCQLGDPHLHVLEQSRELLRHWVHGSV
jgi:hypothetical protein